MFGCTHAQQSIWQHTPNANVRRGAGLLVVFTFPLVFLYFDFGRGKGGGGS